MSLFERWLALGCLMLFETLKFLSQTCLLLDVWKLFIECLVAWCNPHLWLCTGGFEGWPSKRMATARERTRCEASHSTGDMSFGVRKRAMIALCLRLCDIYLF